MKLEASVVGCTTCSREVPLERKPVVVVVVVMIIYDL
jgi:hypothetical protein